MTEKETQKKSSLHYEEKNFDNLSKIYIFYCTQLLYKGNKRTRYITNLQMLSIKNKKTKINLFTVNPLLSTPSLIAPPPFSGEKI